MASLSRRSFLTTSAALTAGSLLARPAAANERINVGVIGCRNRGHQVANTMLRSGDFNIVGLCDADTAMIDKALGELDGKLAAAPKKSQDFRSFLDDPEIDAVVIAAPDHWHALMAVMALDAGKHVYLEKPASYNIADGKAMVAAHATHPKLAFQVGTQQRSGQHFMDAKQFIDEGGLGKVAFARASFITERHLAKIVPDSAPPASVDYEMWIGPAPMRAFNEELFHYNWHFVRDLGTGDMGNWGAHWLDVLRWLLSLDLPERVSGSGGQFVVHDAKEWPDTQTVMYHFPELTLLWELRHWSRFMPGNGKGNCCEINGEKGSILIDRGGWTFYPREKAGKEARHGSSDLELPHVKSFAKALREGGEPTAPIQEGNKSAILCHLGNITAMLNRSVAFDPKAQVITGDPEAEAWMNRPYRAPWDISQYA